MGPPTTRSTENRRVLGSGRSWSSEGRDQTSPDSDSLWAQLLQEMQREGQVPAQKVAGWLKDWAGPGTGMEPVGCGGQGSGRRRRPGGQRLGVDLEKLGGGE